MNTASDTYVAVELATPLKPDEQMEAYTEAVRSGLYARKSGLLGKYDNVRKLWEDEITRIHLRPHLLRLIERSRLVMRRVRIMDLGCGSADGHELLMGVRRRDADLKQREVSLFCDEMLSVYKGVDLNADLIRQAQELFGHHPKMVFEQADFTQGLPLGEKETPYDLYFSSFGTFSHHNDDETAARLLAEIASRTEDYCVIVCDWLGRYSYEWQELWTDDPASLRNMDYVVSYIYGPEEREQRRDELQHLSLRLMSREEVSAVLRRANELADGEIRPLEFFDRSTFTGRHMDSGDYNPHAQPIRTAVNSLHEPNVRTELDSLIVNYVPKAGFDLLNSYFEHLAMCWNTLVRHVQHLLEIYDEQRREFTDGPAAIPASYPPALRDMMDRMERVVHGIGWLRYGLPRENIIEPQLAYALRYLVTSLQQGRGCAHGLVGIFEVDKTAAGARG